jgi:hypothetical protein
MKGRHHLGDLNVGGRIILKLIFLFMIVRTELISVTIAFSQHGTESTTSIKEGKFLTQLSE